MMVNQSEHQKHQFALWITTHVGIAPQDVVLARQAENEL
jgi:hypothetical protein